MSTQKSADHGVPGPGGNAGGRGYGGSIFLFYGEGGHKTQMERLLARFSSLPRENDVTYIGLAEGHAPISTIKNHRLIPMRSKYIKWLTIILTPLAFFHNTVKTFLLMIRYKPKGLISTGPGSVLFPAVLFKVFRKKIVYIESCSRFETRSLTGKYMYRLADRFYVQNKDLLSLYPKAIYAGML
jgi:UDP-N-acetylglucosamine:LPS N-acetylglucosamine transferase